MSLHIFIQMLSVNEGMDFNNSAFFKNSASIHPFQYKIYNGLFILSIFKAGKRRGPRTEAGSVTENQQHKVRAS